MVSLGGSADCIVRKAQSRDASRISAIDIESASLPGALLERAAPGELERGVEVGDVWVAECAQGVVGYAHVDRQCRGRLYVAGVVVVPGMRGHGFGASLLVAALESIELSKLPVCTVTDPKNLTMLKLLFSRGFVGRWALPDYFGPERHRVGFQMRMSGGRELAVVSWYQSSGIKAWLDIISAGYVVVTANFRGEIPLLGVTPFPALDLLPCAWPEYPKR